MGQGKEFRCVECGYHFSAYTGIGFGFPQDYQETVRLIRKGKFGQEWKQLFESRPSTAVNAEQELYVCSSCGKYIMDLNLSLYELMRLDVSQVHEGVFTGANPSVGIEYVMPSDLRRDYKLVKAFPHLCPECGRRMQQYRNDDRLKCPKCQKGQMKLSGMIMWD